MKSPHLYYIAALLLLGFLLFQKPAKEFVKVPAEKGSFEPQEPVYIRDTVKVYVTQWKTKEIKTPNPVNDSLAEAYRDLDKKYKADSLELEQYKMFLSVIQIRPFENTFEDEYIKLSVSGEVQGELLYLTPEYKIKEREIEVPKRLGIDISLQAGYGISGTGLSPYVGIGVSKPILRF